MRACSTRHVARKPRSTSTCALQVIADETQREIDNARVQYAPCGAHNADLFFCIRDLAAVGPMYQYSLAWFIKLFVRSIHVRSQRQHLWPQPCWTAPPSSAYT
jgi:hypothetical protein